MVFNIPTPSFLKKSGSSNSLVSLDSSTNKRSTKLSQTLPKQRQQQPSPSPSPPNSTSSSSASLPKTSKKSNMPQQNLQPFPSVREAKTPPPSLTIATGSTNGPLSKQPTSPSQKNFPHSPRSRQLSDRMRAAPSSLVRQSRSYSHSISSFSYLNDSSDPSVSSLKKSRQLQTRRTVSGHELIKSNRQVLENLPPELSPVVTLINAQKLRTYAVGSFQVPGIDENNNRVWIEVEGKLTGNELAIWRPSEEEYLVDTADEFKPRYINLTDAKFEWGTSTNSAYEYDLKISQTFSESFLIKFNEPQDLHIWSAAICLSNFEYTSLNEAFTAVILSLTGSKLNDIHILLSQKKRFAKNEWCNIRIPQISSKWLKLYVSIIPSDGKKKNGKMEFYLNEKMTKKNLILYVNKLDDVYNVYPEQPNMIDFNSIMKLDGEIFINRNYEALFEHESQATAGGQSGSGSGNLGFSPPRASSFAFKSHSRKSSFSSIGSNSRLTSTTSSFFNNAPSPTTEQYSPSSPTAGFFKKDSKKEVSDFVVTNCLYLMPVHHPGVPPIETMIRNFIDVIDAFRLYGRPSHLFSDKNEPRSMLFGLPSLPHYKYLSMAEAVDVVKQNYRVASQENWGGQHWRVALKSYINQMQIENGFKGHGDLIKLYKSFDNLELDDTEYGISNIESSPKIKLPQERVYSHSSLSRQVPQSQSQSERDSVIDAYLSDPSYDASVPNSLENSRVNSNQNLFASANQAAVPQGTGNGLGAPLEFGQQLRNVAQKVSINPSASSNTEHPYYYMANPAGEYNSIDNSSRQFNSSPLRPKA